MVRLTLVIALASVFLLFAGTLANAANPKVLMKTSKGDITIELYPDKAPITVKNFLGYVDAKFYNGTIFHRVIKDFMIQGGGLTADFAERQAKPPIKNESGNGLKNERGSIAMARTNELDSATCQFFINHVNNFRLDELKYAVFGKVVTGMEVVDAIANSPTMTAHGMKDLPRETITILSVQRL